MLKLDRFKLEFQLHLFTFGPDCIWSKATEKMANDGSSEDLGIHLT